MDKIDKLRMLIHDKANKMFTTVELEELLVDCGENVYFTAALCLEIVQGDPERYKTYSRGGVSATREDLDFTIKAYRQLAKNRSGFESGYGSAGPKKDYGGGAYVKR